MALYGRRFLLTAIGLALLAIALPTAGLQRESASPYPHVRLLATLQNPEVTESSGMMVAQGQTADEDPLFWTHNDSGDGPFLYLFDREGANRGTWKIDGATCRDAEDCAAGPGPLRGRRYLYFGDIGDNAANRTDCVVWRLLEPSVSLTSPPTDRAHARATAPADALPFSYPDAAHDCEALLVHPRTGAIYLVTKEWGKPTSGVYRFPTPLEVGRRVTLIKVADLPIFSSFPPNSSLITGGDIAADGRRLVLRDYQRLYEYSLPDGAASFDEIWSQTPRVFPAPPTLQGEAVCYGTEGRSLYLTSEGAPAPLYEMGR